MIFKFPLSSNSVGFYNHGDLVVCKNSLISVSADFLPHSPSHGLVAFLKAHRGLIFEVTKKEVPKPLNPDPTSGFDDKRAEGGEFSVALGSWHMILHEAGGPKGSLGGPAAILTQIRLAGGIHRSDQK